MKKVVYILKNPIRKGEREITEVTLNKPNVAALRGVKLLDLLQYDTNALLLVLPRITRPMLNSADLASIDVQDLLGLSVEVVKFFEIEKAEDFDDDPKEQAAQSLS